MFAKHTLRSKSPQPTGLLIRFAWGLLAFCIFGFVILRFIVPVAALAVPEVLRRLGVLTDDIKIAGTGSMYPTFPKGKGESEVVRAREIVAWSKMRRYPSGLRIGSFTWFGFTIGRGDIVSFSNASTKAMTIKEYNEELGLVKRVIAVAGDRVQIREGFVVLNGQRLKEAYTARPRSTFGGTFAPDCTEFTVPPGKLFVLGDNRTGSSDSRHELGLIDESDVDHVLPRSDQKEYENLWRDPSGDEDLISQPTLDASLYIQLLNDKRSQAGLGELQLNSKLIASAKIRGTVILDSNDLSFEATGSGYGMEKALGDVGYSNITWGEAPALGFYTAEELIENSFQFPETKEFLLDKNFDDVGVAAVLGDLNGCPTQVVVQHFGGYVPPNYSSTMIANWKKALANLRNVRPSWAKLRNIPEFYEKNKQEVDRMIELIDFRMQNMENIISRMEGNEWLTNAEQEYVDKDNELYQEQDRLAKHLNGR